MSFVAAETLAAVEWLAEASVGFRPGAVIIVVLFASVILFWARG